jgi:hypothetical protein
MNVTEVQIKFASPFSLTFFHFIAYILCYITYFIATLTLYESFGCSMCHIHCADMSF